MTYILRPSSTCIGTPLRLKYLLIIKVHGAFGYTGFHSGCCGMNLFINPVEPLILAKTISQALSTSHTCVYIGVQVRLRVSPAVSRVLLRSLSGIENDIRSRVHISFLHIGLYRVDMKKGSY